MHRTISDYKNTKRKDGRYYVRTHIYGKTKAELQASGNIYSSILLKTGIQCGTIHKSYWLFFSIENGV